MLALMTRIVIIDMGIDGVVIYGIAINGVVDVPLLLLLLCLTSFMTDSSRYPPLSYLRPPLPAL